MKKFLTKEEESEQELIELKSKLKKLQHHKDTTVGLYAFDKDIEIIFEDAPDNVEDAKTVTEAYLLQQVNYLKRIIFQIK